MTQQSPQAQAVNAVVVVPESAKAKLATFWKAHQKQIAAVTAGSDVERVMRVTYSVLYRNPKLVECTPFSLLNGIVLAHQLGLVLGTQEVAIVPYGKEATLIVQYQGKVKLALASKLITSVYADVVLAGEPFEFEVKENGLKFLHKPLLIDRPEPSEHNTVAAYCQLTTSGGGVQTRIVSLNELLSARNRSRGYRYQLEKNGKDNPWITDFQAMALKTAIHRGMKLAPQDARLGLATAVEDEDQGGAAVIAEGLNPGEFADAELDEPLIQTGKEAAAEVAEAKIALLKKGTPPSELEAKLAESVQQVRERKKRQPAEMVYEGAWPDNPPMDRPFTWNGKKYQFNEEAGNFREVEVLAG